MITPRSRSLCLPSLAAALLAVALPATLSAQGTKMGKMEEGEMHASSGWKELDAYHELMMATWHPAKGKDDLKPIKARVGDMAKAAKAWEKSKAPKGCDSPKLKDAVLEVSAGTEELATLVTTSDDAVIKAKLAALHETFEIVEKGCKPEKPE